MKDKTQDILLSVTVVAHNEEKHLPDCLASLGFADDLVIVLDRCTDDSEKIARQFTDKIYVGEWPFENDRRQVAYDACEGKWILVVDADERVTPELAQEIRQAVETYDEGHFVVPNLTYVGDRKITYSGVPDLIADYSLRFFHKDSLIPEKAKRRMHGSPIYVGTKRYLKNAIIHYTDDDIADLISHFNHNTNQRAIELYENPQWRRTYFRCFTGLFTRFFRFYIRRKGYKEGTVGFLIATLGAFYPLISHMKADMDVRLKKHPWKKPY